MDEALTCQLRSASPPLEICSVCKTALRIWMIITHLQHSIKFKNPLKICQTPPGQQGQEQIRQANRLA